MIFFFCISNTLHTLEILCFYLCLSIKVICCEKPLEFDACWYNALFEITQSFSIENITQKQNFTKYRGRTILLLKLHTSVLRIFTYA